MSDVTPRYRIKLRESAPVLAVSVDYAAQGWLHVEAVTTALEVDDEQNVARRVCTGVERRAYPAARVLEVIEMGEGA